MAKKKVEDPEQSAGEEQLPDEESFNDKVKPKKKTSKKQTTTNSAKKNESSKKAQATRTPALKKEKAKAGENDEKQNKKKDFLPGQKYPTPDDEDGALAFYKSLYEKNPRSEMARRYCLEYGVLEPQEATRLLKQMGKAKK